MEKRLYFLLGDLLASALTGALAGWWVVDTVDFGLTGMIAMVVAMFMGMAMGMVAGLLMGLLFTPLFGAMEVMIPIMLAGMVVGMVVGMASVGVALSEAVAVGYGALAGVLCLFAVYGVNLYLSGEVTQ